MLASLFQYLRPKPRTYIVSYRIISSASVSKYLQVRISIRISKHHRCGVVPKVRLHVLLHRFLPCD
ncbi:hypothetical protein D3C80_1388970 [compost metagenome]